TSAEDGADQNPQCSGKKSELRCQNWTDQRPRTGDRREVMAEHNPAVRGDKVASIIQSFRRSGSCGIYSEDLDGDELAVEAIPECVAAERRNYEPDCVDRFSAMQRNGAEGQRSGRSNAHPGQCSN